MSFLCDKHIPFSSLNVMKESTLCLSEGNTVFIVQLRRVQIIPICIDRYGIEGNQATVWLTGISEFSLLAPFKCP